MPHATAPTSAPTLNREILYILAKAKLPRHYQYKYSAAAYYWQSYVEKFRFTHTNEASRIAAFSQMSAEIEENIQALKSCIEDNQNDENSILEAKILLAQYYFLFSFANASYAEKAVDLLNSIPRTAGILHDRARYELALYYNELVFEQNKLMEGDKHEHRHLRNIYIIYALANFQFLYSKDDAFTFNNWRNKSPERRYSLHLYITPLRAMQQTFDLPYYDWEYKRLRYQRDAHLISYEDYQEKLLNLKLTLMYYQSPNQRMFNLIKLPPDPILTAKIRYQLARTYIDMAIAFNDISYLSKASTELDVLIRSGGKKSGKATAINDMLTKIMAEQTPLQEKRKQRVYDIAKGAFDDIHTKIGNFMYAWIGRPLGNLVDFGMLGVPKAFSCKDNRYSEECWDWDSSFGWLFGKAAEWISYVTIVPIAMLPMLVGSAIHLLYNKLTSHKMTKTTQATLENDIKYGRYQHTNNAFILASLDVSDMPAASAQSVNQLAGDIQEIAPIPYADQPKQGFWFNHTSAMNDYGLTKAKRKIKGDIADGVPAKESIYPSLVI